MTTATCTAARRSAAPAPSLLGRARALLAALVRARPAPAAIGGEIVLADWQARSVDVGRAQVELHVLEGEVVVTAEGDVVDHVVGAGGAFRSERRGRHVVAALAPSRVRLGWR